VYQAANHRLFEGVSELRGESLAALSAKFGPPNGTGNMTWVYNAAPWYAPLGFSKVVVISTDGEHVGYAYYDAD
jgi:hypothetical protein